MSWKLALHTVSYAGVWRGQTSLPIERVLEKASELGFDGVMIMAKRPHLSPLDYDENARKRLREKIESLGLEVPCLAGYVDFTAGVDRPMTPMIEVQAVYVGELARLARDLGCGMIRVFTGFERPGVPFDKLWEICVRGLKLASQRAAEFGVTLAVQNHHDIAIHHESLRWLLEEVDEPNCKAAFDAWAPALQGLKGEELKEAVRRIAPFLVHTTVADYIKHHRFIYDQSLTNYIRREARVYAVPMGTGIVDYPSFFDALREIGYRGWVAYEMCEVLKGGGDEENLDRCARAFLDYMRKL
ncbi:sugar phosphate isomerase/epimerase [Candidatus Poribacteria bacterium]|nr:sugar phosphate isomerase/epimerase [Candidatus Poribacteria bacterium]